MSTFTPTSTFSICGNSLLYPAWGENEAGAVQTPNFTSTGRGPSEHKTHNSISSYVEDGGKRRPRSRWRDASCVASSSLATQYVLS